MGMIMHDDVPYGEGTSYTQGTGIAINNNVIAVDADNTPTEGSEKPVKSKGVSSTVKQIYADNGVLGAKNLLPNNATSQTKNGVTFTVNADGSVTANGTATASTDLIVSRDLPLLYGGRYILSGCPSGGAVSKYRITAYRVDSIDGQSGSLFDIGDGLEFTYKNMTGNVLFIIYIESGQTVNNLTFYPMLRLASDPDDTYVPYAMTNRELTENKQDKLTLINSIVTGVPTGITPKINDVRKYGKNVSLVYHLQGVTADAFASIGTIPDGYRPMYSLRGYEFFNHHYFLDANGKISCMEALSNESVFIAFTYVVL